MDEEKQIDLVSDFLSGKKVKTKQIIREKPQGSKTKYWEEREALDRMLPKDSSIQLED